MIADSLPVEPDGSSAEKLIRDLACVSDRDGAALRRVYDQTSAKLFGICFRICADRSGAEDVMQDVLIKIWTHAGTFDPTRSSPITWLCAIARNTSIDWLRVNDRNPIQHFDAIDTISDKRPGAEEDLLNAERQERLHHCLEELEDRQRFCIRAAFFDGFTYSDLAGQMDTPINTVKTWVRRGMQRLKMCLSDG